MTSYEYKIGDSVYCIRGWFAGHFGKITEIKPSGGKYDYAVRFENGETNEYMSYCLVPEGLADEYRNDHDD